MAFTRYSSLLPERRGRLSKLRLKVVKRTFEILRFHLLIQKCREQIAIFRSSVLSCFSLSLALLCCVPLTVHGDVYFETTYGTGPDKWASLWLITRFVGGAKVHVILNNSAVSEEAVSFDVEGSALNRTGERTSYSEIKSFYILNDIITVAIGQILHEIEIGAWSGEVSLESRIVEQGFRNMQLRHGRDKVTKECYLNFFDNVAARIEVEGLLKLASPNDLIPNSDCMDRKDPWQQEEAFNLAVPTLALLDVLRPMAAGDSPVFIDTRETWEFEEGHIPGAQNLKLREINEESAQTFLKDSLVIAYCVKDFRGYEAARKLRSYGVNAAIMTPHGLRGWIEAGLPVAGPRGLPADKATAELKRVALKSVEAQ